MTAKPFPILVDIDEVVLAWNKGFEIYLKSLKIQSVPGPPTTFDLCAKYPSVKPDRMLEHIQCFTHTMGYRTLDLIPEAEWGLFTLRDKFPESMLIAVSCCGLDEITLSARKYALRRLPFTSFIPLGITEPKDRVYSQFQPGVVIDDSVKNITHAVEIGKSTRLNSSH